jgi:hypothetical protein
MEVAPGREGDVVPCGWNGGCLVSVGMVGKKVGSIVSGYIDFRNLHFTDTVLKLLLPLKGTVAM